MENRLREIVFQLRHLAPHKIHLAILVIICIIIRVPRVPGIIGSDAFIVLWMGYAIHRGFIMNWVLTPLSPFGLFPFASYPLGLPLVVAGMINAGLSYESIALTMSAISCIIGIFGSYRLGFTISKSHEWSVLYAFIFSTGHLFIRNTYFTVLSRGLFMAILPWFLSYAVSYIRQPNKGDGIHAFAYFLLLVLVHALSIFILLYVIVFLIASVLFRILLVLSPYLRPICHRIISRARINLKSQSYFVILTQALFFSLIALLSYIIGLSVVPVDFGKTTPFLLSNDTLVGFSMNLIIDYGIRLGLFSIFFPLGILASFVNNKKVETRILHMVLVSMIMFTLPTSLYASLIFYPVFLYYSLEGFFVIKNKVSVYVIASFGVWFLCVFTVVYDIMVVHLPSWLVFAVAFCIVLWAIVSVKQFYSHHNFKFDYRFEHSMTLLLLTVVVFSIVCTDGVILQNGHSFMTSDELQMIQIVKSTKSGFVFSCSLEVGRRFQAYGVPSIGAFNEDASLYFGWLNSSDVIRNSEFRVSNLILHGRLFSYTGYRPEHTMFESLIQLDLTNLTEYDLAINMGLRWIVVERTSDGYSPLFHSVGGDIYSNLLSSAPLTCRSIYEGTKYSLFALY